MRLLREKVQRRALIMKGGGVKGLAYIGALRELGEKFQFNWYVGTSAGAITAILLAAGYTIDELDEILKNKDFNDFLDAKPWQIPFNLLFHQGLYNADTFTIWLDRLLAEKMDSFGRVTLGQLQQKNRVTVYASRRNRDALIFDSAYPEHQNTYASFAARCSMSIPFFFIPQRDQGMRVYDGGARNNYPVRILLESSPNVDFIGLYLGPEHFEGQGTKSNILSDLIAIWTEPVDEKSVTDHKDRTIIIDPRPISTIDFNLSPEEKQFLLEAGRVSALKFLVNAQGELADSEAKDRLEQARQSLKTHREELTLRRVRKKRNRGFYTLVVIALLMISTILINRIVKPCFMYDLSDRELSEITATLDNSKNYDPSAARALSRLLAVPANCRQRERVDAILISLSARSTDVSGNIDVAHIALKELIARIQPGKEGETLLDKIAQAYPHMDEASQDVFDNFIKTSWESDSLFRQEFVSVAKSTTDETTRSIFRDFLDRESR